METFTGLKNFVENPQYHEQRQRCVAKLDISAIDTPIVELISGLTKLPYCFTLQSCYGHFVYRSDQDPHNIEPLPAGDDSITTVKYSIAYVAFCIENSSAGRDLAHDLAQVPSIDPEYIQFGCAEWFWKQQVNTYALQVEPERHKTKDRISIEYHEALHIEKTRNRFFAQLGELLQDKTDKKR